MVSNSVMRRKRGNPATGQDRVTAIRLSPELRQAIDMWASGLPERRLSRSEAVRHILTQWLRERGYLGAVKGLRPSELTSENDG